MPIDVITAMKQRHSVRAFLDKPVQQADITAILEAARFAASGVNTQPWQVCVVTGQTKQAISNAVLAEHAQGVKPNPDYLYYPREWHEPYKSRRFACGMALYGALDIKREETEKRQAVWQANYRFFDAPVGLFFFIDAFLEKGSWMDMGMFMQNVMLAAIGVGLATCPQAAMAEYPNIVRNVLGVGADKHLVSGMALGYADTMHPVNAYRTEREAVENFTRFFD
jgi:nitroreductase